MKRPLFTLGSALSLLLCLATVVLWVWNGTYFGTYLIKSRGSNAFHEFTFNVIGKDCDYCPVAGGYIAVAYVRTDYVPIRAGFLPHPSLTIAGLSDAMASYAGFHTGYRPLFQPAFSFRHEKTIQTSNSGRMEYNNNFGGEVSSDEAFRFSLPIWAASVVTSILPFMFVAGRLTGRRRLPHQCPTCRYNLTGNTSGICPECGTACTSSKTRAEKVPAVPHGEK